MADTPVEDVALDDNIPDVSLTEAFPDATESPESPEVQTEDTPDEKTEEPDSTEGQEQPEEQPQNAETDAQAEQRRQNEMAAQRRIMERQRQRNAVADALDTTYGPKTEDELVEGGLSKQEAQLQALREEMAYKEQRAAISELNADLTMQSAQIAQELPVFNPNSPEFDQEFTQKVDQLYLQASRLQTATLSDGRVVVTNADVPPYDFYKEMYDIYGRGASKGQQQGQQQYQEMLSRTENPGGSSSTGSGDDLADLEERLGNVRIA